MTVILIPIAVAVLAADTTVHGQPGPLAPAAVTSDWPSFLGPTLNGTSPETNLNKSWLRSGPPLVWEMDCGTGYAGPAVVGGKLVHYHRIANDDIVDCRDAATGKMLWQSRAPSSYSDRFDFNNGPRSSPVIDGDRVYVHSAEGLLQCLDYATGRVLWKHNTNQEYNITADVLRCRCHARDLWRRTGRCRRRARPRCGGVRQSHGQDQVVGQG